VMGNRARQNRAWAGLMLAVLMLSIQISPTVAVGWAASPAHSDEPELPAPTRPDMDAAPTEITEIQAALPTDSALIQYLHVPSVSHGSSTITPPLEPHYAALLVFAGDLDLVDLGSAIAIDRQIDAFRKAAIPKQDTTPSARALYDAVLGPIVARVGTVRRLFIVPDANLHLVPFAALMDERSGYAIERFSIH
jgi:CHAT domain-containing protein